MRLDQFVERLLEVVGQLRLRLVDVEAMAPVREVGRISLRAVHEAKMQFALLELRPRTAIRLHSIEWISLRPGGAGAESEGPGRIEARPGPSGRDA
ncbi:hypothetical protein [Aureimonas sp. AU22]|uniref:hypothetical protein n=1 Tax=Aureimonas sp. AU22 TaxID=1638162 RepID=UPI0012E39B46|nr:hypothetical protein [Aureimonas sp. AU22]